MNVYRHNAITTIKNNSFAKLVNIFTLSLKGNDMIKIEDQGFNGLTKLKNLFLTDNRLVSINKEVCVTLHYFPWLCNLLSLCLKIA